MKNNNTLGTDNRKTILIHYLFFLVIIWLAYFFSFRGFGLYEDDYWFVGKPDNLTFQGLLNLLGENILNIEGGQGRIIGFTVPQLLTFLSYKVGGLGGVYILGSLIVFLNSVLVFQFARRFLPITVAALATILFILYPADTTKPLLVHIYQLQLSLIFVLLALNQYAAGRKILAFILALCSLLTYESAFLLFLTVPLFVEVWNKQLGRKFILHMAICFIILFCLFIIRKLLGETRAGEVEGVETAKMAVMSLFIGPIVSAYAFIHAIIEALASIGLLKWILFLSLIILTTGVILSDKISFPDEKIRNQIKFPFISITIEGEKLFSRLIRLIIASTIMLCFSYLFAFTHYPPNILHGRSTSVHLAGSVAGSLLAALIIYFVFYLFKENKAIRVVLYATTILILSLLLSRGYLIQHDFKESWKEQKTFWREIVKLTPDAKENTLILVDVKNQREDLKNIQTYSWPIPDIYNLIVSFDTSWNPVPKVAVIGNSFPDSLYCDKNGTYFVPVYPFMFDDREKVYLEDGNIIYLEFAEGKAARIDTTLNCDSCVVRTLPVNNTIKEPWKLNSVGYMLLK